ncbi:hypothetical protein FB639_004976, partial [Coemansia asiatica]
SRRAAASNRKILKQSETSTNNKIDINIISSKMEVIMMPPPSQVYLCKLCYSEYTNIHSARNHMCSEHFLNLTTEDTWGYVSVTSFS